MELYFLFSVDSNIDELCTTFSLSHNIFVGPSIGTLNILSLYLNPYIASTRLFIAINYEENVPDSTVLCLFLYYKIGAFFTKIIYPICGLRVTLSLACDASTYDVVNTSLPIGCG